MKVKDNNDYEICLKPAKRKSLSQIVLDQLLDQINRGVLRPGDLLPAEPELMRMMSVGKSSVREAIRSLNTLGLLETSPGKGTIVTESAHNPFEHIEKKGRSINNLKRSSLMDLLEVRQNIEGFAAWLAAERSTQRDQKEIARNLAAVERDIKIGKTYFRPNFDFHLSIARASHNFILAESVRNLIGQVRNYREHLMKFEPGMPKRDMEEHAAIYAAICSKDSETAQKEMSKHIQSFADLISSLKFNP